MEISIFDVPYTAPDYRMNPPAKLEVAEDVHDTLREISGLAVDNYIVSGRRPRMLYPLRKRRIVSAVTANTRAAERHHNRK